MMPPDRNPNSSKNRAATTIRMMSMCIVCLLMHKLDRINMYVYGEKRVFINTMVMGDASGVEGYDKRKSEL